MVNKSMANKSVNSGVAGGGASNHSMDRVPSLSHLKVGGGRPPQKQSFGKKLVESASLTRSSSVNHHTKLQLNGIENQVESLKMGQGAHFVVNNLQP